MRYIAGLSDHWAEHGAKWIFVVEDIYIDEEADEYVDRYGISFGFRTDDRDNSAGGFTIVWSGLYAALPWVGVIRKSDMVLLYVESDDPDLAAVAVELSTE